MIRACRPRIWENKLYAKWWHGVPTRNANKTNGPEPLARSGPFGFREGKPR
jgi:hypothetical protein